jgi:hypothetical protein
VSKLDGDKVIGKDQHFVICGCDCDITGTTQSLFELCTPEDVSSFRETLL